MSSNTKQVFWLSLGNLFTFGFSIISVAILSRYLPKEDYGTYKQVIYIYGTLLVIFSMGLPKAYGYFIPKVEDNQMKDVINKISSILLLVGFVFSVVLYFGSGIIAEALKNSDLKTALKYFSLVPLFTLPTLGIENILAALKKSHIMTLYTILSRSLMLLCTAIPVLVFNLGYLEAIQGFVAASFISFIVALSLKNRTTRGQKHIKSEISYREILKFSIPLLYASFWGLIISSSDQFFISRYFGSKVFAEFSNGFFEFPIVSMVISAIATILLPVFSENITRDGISEELKRMWNSALEKTIILVYPLLIFLIFYAETLMILLYGDGYTESAFYFKLRTALSFVQLIALFPLMLALGTGATKYYSRVHMFIAFSILFLEYLAIVLFNSPYVIIYVSITMRIVLVLLLMKYIADIFNIKLIDLFPIKLQLSLVLFCSAIMLLLKFVFEKQNLDMLIELLMVGTIYVLFVLLVFKILKVDFGGIIAPLLIRKK
jgi:Membrane protein involved in the export of O-antigen and teichoic acid